MDRPYTGEPETLERAFDGATYVVRAWEDETLVGVRRVLSDNASSPLCAGEPGWTPTISGEGIGRALLGEVLERWLGATGRQNVLMDRRPPRAEGT